MLLNWIDSLKSEANNEWPIDTDDTRFFFYKQFAVTWKKIVFNVTQWMMNDTVSSQLKKNKQKTMINRSFEIKEV